MAAVREVEKELNKLNKSDLIRIITEKSVPSDVKISEKVIKFMEDSQNSESSEASSVSSENHLGVNTKPVSLIELQCELKISKIELDASKRLISELERTISNQEYIISLIKNTDNVQVNNERNTNGKTSVVNVHTKTGNARTNVIESKANFSTDINKNKKGNQRLESKNNQITHQQVSTAVLKAQTHLKMDDIQKLSKNPEQTSPANKIIGANSENDDVASKEKIWIYATKYKQSYTSEKMKNYLETKFPEHEFTCTLYENKITGSNSFRITADADLRDLLFSPETWPTGVEISEYFFRRRRNFHKSSKYSRSTSRRYQ